MSSGRLDEIERRGTANGVPGLRRLSPSEMVEIEPYVRGVSALHSPQTAIVDFPAVAAPTPTTFATPVGPCGSGSRWRASTAAAARSASAAPPARSSCSTAWSSAAASTPTGSRRWRVRIASPGSCRSAASTTGSCPRATDLVRGLIYPVPDPAYPFLGVHFTRRVDGGVDIGPNAVLAFKREGYTRTDFSAADLIDVFRSQGFRRLARKHWRMGAAEMWGSVSKRAFIDRARDFIPALTPADVEPAPAGVRAQALDPDGSLVDDFRITRVGGLVLVRNAPSPAATSSLAIGEYVVDQLNAGG